MGSELIAEAQVGGKVYRVRLNHYTEAPDSYSLEIDGERHVVGHESLAYVLAEFRDDVFEAVTELMRGGE